MMKFFLALIVSSMVSFTVAEECASITVGKVKQLWIQWNAALQTYEPEVIAKLYHENSVLLPTLSNKIRPDAESKIGYFEHFMAKKPIGTIKEDYVNIKSCNMASYNGIYTFDLTAVGKKADARFSYTYTFEDGEWKIKTHHSSLMPEAVATHRRSLRLRDSDIKSVEFTIAPTKPEKCADIDEAGIKALWNTWNAALSTQDPEKVADLYWNADSILLPTLSNQVRDTRSEKVNYFEHFLAKKPTGVVNQDFVSVGCNSAQYNGVYTFYLTNPDTQAVTTAMARFTYVFTTYPASKGVWRIETHHSSLMPNEGGLEGERRKLSEIEINFDRKVTEDEKLMEVSFA